MISSHIAYVGMTHLGLVSAVAAAEKGFSVVCYDPDQQRIELLKKGKSPVVEPQLLELMRKNAHLLHYSAKTSDLKDCCLVYISCDVPTDECGQSDLVPIRMLIDSVCLAMGRDSCLVILSQVPPGFTRQIAFDFSRLFYQVETLVFGQAVERALKPERFIIGAFRPDQPLPSSLFTFLRAFGSPLLPMCYESAELSKIAINMFLVSSVSTSNTIAALCEKMGANWAEIVPALRLDKRIGENAYLAAGLGIAGGNLERDLATFCLLADLHGTEASIVRAWQENSRYRRNWVLQKIHEYILPRHKNPVFAVLGLAYKKNTSSTKNSPSLELLYHLRGFAVKAFDPAIQSLPDCYPKLEVVSSTDEAYRGADVLCIMTSWDEFGSLSVKTLAKALKGKTIIDPFGVLDHSLCESFGFNHFRLGVYESIQTYA